MKIPNEMKRGIVEAVGALTLEEKLRSIDRFTIDEDERVAIKQLMEKEESVPVKVGIDKSLRPKNH